MRDKFPYIAHWRWFYCSSPLPPPSFFLMVLAYVCSIWLCPVEMAHRPGLELYGWPGEGLIPFIPLTLPFYLSFFSFYWLHKPLLMRGRAGPVHYQSIENGLYVIVLISMACFVLFPARVDLRDHAELSLSTGAFPGWLTAACRGLFSIDQPGNAWPSLVASQTSLIMLGISFYRLYSPRKLLTLWGFWLVLMISLLTMKQHYLWDLATGLILAMLLFLRLCLWPVLLPALRRACRRKECNAVKAAGVIPYE